MAGEILRVKLFYLFACRTVLFVCLFAHPAGMSQKWAKTHWPEPPTPTPTLPPADQALRPSAGTGLDNDKKTSGLDNSTRQADQADLVISERQIEEIYLHMQAVPPASLTAVPKLHGML